MASIEERAEKYADELLNTLDFPKIYNRLHNLLVEAYLSGSGQAQRDYTTYAVRSREPFYAPWKQGQ